MSLTSITRGNINNNNNNTKHEVDKYSIYEAEVSFYVAEKKRYRFISVL